METVTIDTTNVETAEQAILDVWEKAAAAFGAHFSGPDDREWNWYGGQNHNVQGAYTGGMYRYGVTAVYRRLMVSGYRGEPSHRVTQSEADYLAGSLIAAIEHLSIGAWRDKENGSISRLKKVYDSLAR